MQFTTKFNVGDRIWTVRNCKACELEVKSITVEAEGIRYVTEVVNDGSYAMAFEKDSFKTKQELIDYIVA